MVSVAKLCQYWFNHLDNKSDQYESKLVEAKIAIEARAAVRTEQEKKHVSEHFLTNMDEYTKAELSDNVWLKQEVWE